MKSKPDDDHIYPIADCTKCGSKEVPFNTVWWPYEDGYRKVTYCLNCHYGEPENIKGYISLLELEEMEWDTEL